MATITAERMRELLELYNKLKERITAIDDKYKLDYVEPKITLPDSLSLEKMTYTPKSESELRALAEQYVSATVLSKQRTLDSSYSTKLKSLGRKRTEASRELSVKLKKIDEEYAQALLAVDRKLINNGLLFSTTASTMRSAAATDYNTKKSETNLDYEEDLKALDTEESDLDAVYQESCAQLDEEKEALIAKRYEALLEAEKRARTNVDKYNNSIEEKEQRYQYTRAKFIESMRRAERDRVLDMTKLYLQLGDVTYRDRMKKEKYAVAQDAFWPLLRHEAIALMTFDSFLYMHLENYYSTFENWVNNSLVQAN